MRHEILVTLPERAIADVKVLLALAVLVLVAVALFDKWPKWR